MAYPANYRDDVCDKKAAAEALKGAPVRAYITWRLNFSDSEFFLSYNSVAFGISHIPILRLPDGYFRCMEGLDKTRYPSLGDFLATRQYLQAPHDRSPAPATASSGADGLTQRKRMGKEYLPRTCVCVGSW
jgi:hypothetical protein